ncbi:MAG: hypothetical protein LBF42_02005, partial [Puniceicoccales bacterium]|nr:hypothetical protein [Puniceicoccales bacterium]
GKKWIGQENDKRSVQETRHSGQVVEQNRKTIVISLQKSILNSVEERRKEVEDVGEFPFEVSLEFFDGIEVRKIGRHLTSEKHTE